MKLIHNWKKASVCDIETEWRDYPEYPDRYQVSNLGDVRSKPFLKRTRNRHGEITFMTKERKLAQFLNKDGYYQIRLMVNGKKFTRKVHRMVAQTFLGYPREGMVVNHKDSNRGNNKVNNLEWCTRRENVQHGYDSGSNSNEGEQHPRAKLNNNLVLEIKLLEFGHSVKEISEKLDLSYDIVYRVIKRDNWRHVEPEGSGWVGGEKIK